MKIKMLIITIINVLLCLCICAATTFAWLAMNNKVTSNNMGMDIQGVSNVTTISCYALKYDGVFGASCYQIDDDHHEITMTEYDKIFTDKNVNTPLILRLEVANIKTSANSYISLKVPSVEKYIRTKDGTETNSYTTGYTFTSGSSGFKDTTAFSIQHYITNVLNITIGVGDNSIVPVPTDSEYYEENETIFNTQHTLLSSVEDEDLKKCFVKQTDNQTSSTKSFEKQDEIELRIDYTDYADYLFDATDEGSSTPTKHLILYIMFDYDIDLMETFIASILDGENIFFNNDIGTMTVENGGDS